MAWSTHQFFLAGLLVFTGSINTIATRWADITVVPGRPDGHLANGTSTHDPHPFSHPFLQALGMFIGEFSCLIVFKILYWIYSRRSDGEGENQEALLPMLRGNRQFNPLLFLAPTLCDMIGTTTLYMGMNLTHASSAQMFRGAVVIFTGIFSIVFLKRRLRVYHWIGILLILMGLAVVGCADLLFSDHSSSRNAFLGDCLIVAAQIITAAQMVLEEKFVVGIGVAPLEVVGWEGFFGVLCMGSLLVPLSYITYQGAAIEDSIDGIYQILQSPQVATAYVGTVVSIAFFNFAGVSVTKELSATTRMVLDSVRTVFIWTFTVLVGWISFVPLTLLGFFSLVLGMTIYNHIIKIPCLSHDNVDDSREEQERGLVDED